MLDIYRRTTPLLKLHFDLPGSQQTFPAMARRDCEHVEAWFWSTSIKGAWKSKWRHMPPAEIESSSDLVFPSSVKSNGSQKVGRYFRAVVVSQASQSNHGRSPTPPAAPSATSSRSVGCSSTCPPKPLFTFTIAILCWDWLQLYHMCRIRATTDAISAAKI